MNCAARQIIDRHLARRPSYIRPGSLADACVRPVAGTLANAIAASLLPFRAHAGTNDTTKVVATWIAPATGSVLTAPASIVLSVDAEAKQANQPIVSVEFFNGATLIGSRTTASSGLNYQTSWPNVSPGTYSLTATATNDKGDFDSTGPVTITVIKANQSIGGFSPQTPIIYAPNASFTLTATGGPSANPILFASATPAICRVSGSTVMIQSAGTCTLTADQAGNANYNAAPQAAASVTINKASHSITGFTPASPITYQDQADRVRIEGLCDADRIRAIGLAEADKIRATGLAQTEATAKQVEAFGGSAVARRVEIGTDCQTPAPARITEHFISARRTKWRST